MDYIKTSFAPEGLQDTHEKMSRILSALHKNGFTNPIAYGGGLSNFLLSNNEPKNIAIQCDLPDALKPGTLAQIFKTEYDNKRQIVLKARSVLDNGNVPLALSGLTFGRSFDTDNNDSVIRLQTRGNGVQRIEILAHTSDGYRRPDVTALLADEYGTMNKIAMHYDADLTSIVTTHHPSWKADAQDRKFRIPQEADFDEINSSLAYYFLKKSYGSGIKLVVRHPVDDTSVEMTRLKYIFDVQNAALKAHEVRYKRIAEHDTAQHQKYVYQDAADFMGALCEK